MQNGFYGMDLKSLVLCSITYALNFLSSIHLTGIAKYVTVFAAFATLLAGLTTSAYNLFRMWLDYKKSKKG